MNNSVAGAYGKLTLNGNGSYSYVETASSASIPNGGTQDNFTFTVSDINGNSVAATLSILVASASDTLLVGTAGGTVSAGNGNSVIDGTAGNETLNAGNGGDVISGNNDTVTAGANSKITVRDGSKDTVYAGANDTINLGKGNDTVAFGVSASPPIGNEVVNGFGTNYVDVIEFNRALFASYAAMMSAGDIVQSGSNTLITDHAGDTVTLNGVSASSLTANNFKFA